jgi:hypothetical protein
MPYRMRVTHRHRSGRTEVRHFTVRAHSPKAALALARCVADVASQRRGHTTHDFDFGADRRPLPEGGEWTLEDALLWALTEGRR